MDGNVNDAPHRLVDVTLRKPEQRDAADLLRLKNDPDVMSMLGGFGTGYTSATIERWIDRLASASDDLVWVIVDEQDDVLGHVGLYQIDHRVRLAELGILVGRSAQGKGVGMTATSMAVEYGFSELNLNRIELWVLRTNPIARQMYEKLGFVHEGTRREAQYRGGVYLDLDLMGLLRADWQGC